MSDVHEMIIDDIRKMVCREAIALEKYRIGRDITVTPCYIPHEDIMESGLALRRNTEPDYRLYALSLILRTLSLCEIGAVPVISLVLALRFNLLLPDLLQPLRGAVAVVCLSLCHKLLGILLVYIEALGLDVRTTGTTYDRTFIPLDAKEAFAKK